MVTKEAIDAALSAHALWKARLETAIETGKSEFKPEIVKKDSACQFGQWLYGLSGADVMSEDYKKVKGLHADFHLTAAAILELALTGKADAAKRELEPGGGYRKATGKLILALEGWKAKL